MSQINRLIEWLKQRLDRTIFMSIKFTLPEMVTNPHAFLGFLTFAVFLILGITGALLMIYYVPTFEGAYESVKLIDEEIQYGFAIRNIHYHASNAMVLLALLHMFYQFFSGRYKIRNELLWVTGMVLGTLTIMVAFTGYDLILNERAALAIQIAKGLTRSIPGIGADLMPLIVGSGINDLILRFYTLHVFIIPMLMLVLMLVHFPRYLVFDIPMVAIVSGLILIVGGFFPIEVGTKYVALSPPGITFPEWYLSGLYALLRTQIDAFVAGMLLPLIVILAFIVVPFVDKSKKFAPRDRPFFTAMGITAIGQIIVSTIWGFRGSLFEAVEDKYVDGILVKSAFETLWINEYIFYGSMALIAIVSYIGVYQWAKRKAPPRKTASSGKLDYLSGTDIKMVFLSMIGFMVLINILAVLAIGQGLRNLVLIEVGVILLTFGVTAHTYRTGKKVQF